MQYFDSAGRRSCSGCLTSLLDWWESREGTSVKQRSAAVSRMNSPAGGRAMFASMSGERERPPDMGRS